MNICSRPRLRVSHIYPQNQRSYSQAIRAEIVEVFGVEISGESLRPLFGELRRSILSETKVDEESPLLPAKGAGNIQFNHHLGILFFSKILLRVEHVGREFGWLLKQWLCSILLGAVNVEQSKLLDLDGLVQVIGRTQKSPHPQRVQLASNDPETVPTISKHTTLNVKAKYGRRTPPCASSACAPPTPLGEPSNLES